MNLREYLKENCINHKAFARKLEITPASLYNIIKGRDFHLSTALKIEKITEGKVKCSDMGPEYILKGDIKIDGQLELGFTHESKSNA